MTPVLQVAEEYLKSEVGPRANLIDGDLEALRTALEGLCKLGLMALRRPAEFGGPALNEADFRSFQESVARYSGSLAFLQTQHQSAVSMIAKGDNADLKARYLPKMADGEALVGIGFSQLRRAGPPVLRAERVTEGFRLSGSAPWVTGFTLFGEFLVGAALEDGQAVFGVVPFVPTEGITFGPVMRLAAMESPQTVAAQFDGFILRDEQVAFLKPPNWIHDNDLINITVQGFFAAGCAQAGLDIVAREARAKKLDFVQEAHDRLGAELDQCRAAMRAAQDAGSEDVTTDDKLQVRAWAIDLATRCAHAAVAASSGAANRLDHDAQRVFRESLVYTVSAQTTPIMRATLERLSRRDG